MKCILAKISFLHPLKKVTDLFLSNNRLSRISDADLSSLHSLKILAVDHNEIEKVCYTSLYIYIYSIAFVIVCKNISHHKRISCIVF